MSKIRIAVTAIVTAVVVSIALPSSAAVDHTPKKGFDLDAVGLAANGLSVVQIDFTKGKPKAKSRTITGLTTDTSIVGIDYRVQDGLLYGLGNQGGIYTIAPSTGAATLATDRARVTILPASGPYDIDFNPVANALRIVAGNGANIRVPFATANAAAINDGALTRPAIAPATGNVPATGLNGAAYTNNDLDGRTGTTLFDIDTERDQVTIQAPANSGTTAATGITNVDFGSDIGFDIFAPRTKSMKAKDNEAMVVDNSRVYTLNLLTGVASPAGKLPVAGVTDIAIAITK